MTTDKPRPERPLWVKIALWGVSSRGSAWLFCVLSLIAAAVCIGVGFTDKRFFFGALMLIAAIWYYAALRWVDRHDRWP